MTDSQTNTCKNRKVTIDLPRPATVYKHVQGNVSQVNLHFPLPPQEASYFSLPKQLLSHRQTPGCFNHSPSSRNNREWICSRLLYRLCTVGSLSSSSSHQRASQDWTQPGRNTDWAREGEILSPLSKEDYQYSIEACPKRSLFNPLTLL